MWKGKFVHDKSKCRKLHIGTKVESQPNGIAPPSQALIDELEPVVTKFYLPGNRKNKGKGRGGKDNQHGRKKRKVLKAL